MFCKRLEDSRTVLFWLSANLDKLLKTVGKALVMVHIGTKNMVSYDRLEMVLKVKMSKLSSPILCEARQKVVKVNHWLSGARLWFCGTWSHFLWKEGTVWPPS